MSDAPIAETQDATLEDVERLMELQETVKESYAEIGRLRKKIKATTSRRREQAAKAKAEREAEIKRLAEAARIYRRDAHVDLSGP